MGSLLLLLASAVFAIGGIGAAGFAGLDAAAGHRKGESGWLAVAAVLVVLAIVTGRLA